VAAPATGTCGLKRLPADVELDSRGSPVTSVGIVRRQELGQEREKSRLPLAQLAHYVTPDEVFGSDNPFPAPVYA